MRPYFAYGSNLEPMQMRERCPDHRVLAVARLDDWQLLFRGKSVRWGDGAVATIEPQSGAIVWGVVFELNEVDFSRLDSYEAFVAPHDPANFYDKIRISVSGQNDSSWEAETYQMIPQEPGPPSQIYLNAIQIGARHHKLPAIYQERLKEIEAF